MVWPRCAYRGNESGSTATLACRRCRPPALPALTLYQPRGCGGTRRHEDTKRWGGGTWCNGRAGHRRCTVRAWWYERRTDPWFVITTRALDRAARPMHDRGVHRTATTHLRLFRTSMPSCMPTHPTCSPPPSCLRATPRANASCNSQGQCNVVERSGTSMVCGLTARAGATNLAALQRSRAVAVDRWLFRL